MNYLEKMMTDIELLSAEGIRQCFENGIDPNGNYKGQSLFNLLVSGYARSHRFKECVRRFVEYGLDIQEPVLTAVLMDDAGLLKPLLNKDPRLAKDKTYTLKCAFTPLYKVTLLHICAEFNHLHCAQALIENGADINAIAGTDEYGFGGQTPLFHTVNQNDALGMDVFQLLVDHAADLSVTIRGVIWGGGYEWETFIPSVDPISYAMMGLLPQFQRKEQKIYETVAVLMKARFGTVYFPQNVPNRYLHANH